MPSKPQPGPNKFSVTFFRDGEELVHDFYAFFSFDKDPSGTEFWELTNVVDSEGFIVDPDCDSPHARWSIRGTRQIFREVEELFYDE